MNHYRYTFAAVALASCHLALAQAPEPALTKEGGFTLAGRQASASAPHEEGSKASDAAAAEPRILRGTDRVIAAPKATQGFDGANVAFNFEEAPVAEVVRTILGDVLKADYVLHPPLSGTVTLATRAAVAPDQAAFLLESALQANGLALVRDARGTYHVGKVEALRGIGSAVRLAGGGASLPPGYGAIVIPLQFIGAAEMAAILKPLMQSEALIRVDTVRNLLVLAGSRAQAEGWLDLVSTFDVDLLKGMSVGVFPLKHATIKEVESALRLMSAGTGSAAPSATSAPAGVAGQAPGAASAAVSLGDGNPLFGALRIMPIERLNSILVVTPRASYLDEARRWIERLDQPNDNGAEPQLFIYQVKNVNARHLATVLGGIFGDTRAQGVTSTGVAPGLTSATANSLGQASGTGLFAGGASNQATGLRAAGGLAGSTGSGLGVAGARGNQATTTPAPAAATLGSVRVMADDLNNSVLVWSTRAEYNKIESTLKRLDLPPTQVLIEASIIEVTLSNDLQYGLQWEFNDNRATTGYTGLGRLSSNQSSATDFLKPTSGFSYTLKNPAGNVRAILNALSAKTSVKVLASPSLMVLDNHTAGIVVGTQTPILAGTTTNLEGTVSTTNIQYKDTGVSLQVTPSVNSGNIVTMQLDQSVSDVGAPDDVTKQRAFLQRQLSSKVAVRSGESIVMGGLIQERSTSSKSGIPILHTIPVLGNLFGNTTNEGARTELIVVITPRVVRSDIDIREVSDDLRDRMRGLLQVREFESSRNPKAASTSQVAPPPADQQ